MDSWHLPNLSVQIAPDCIAEYLNFHFFLGGGGGMPPTPQVSPDFVAPNGRSHAHVANILNYATPGLTNKKRLGTPLTITRRMVSLEDCFHEIIRYWTSTIGMKREKFKYERKIWNPALNKRNCTNVLGRFRPMMMVIENYRKKYILKCLA